MPYICLKCIGDVPLRETAEETATRVLCNYCQERDLGISMEKLAEIVDDPFRRYYCKGNFEPVWHGDSDHTDYEQEGEPLVDILQEELEIDYDPAKDLAEILENSDPADIRDGEEPFYSSDQNYHRSYLSPCAYFESWRLFSDPIKHQRRFFDEDARAQLAEILGEPGSVKSAGLPVMELGPGTRIEALYRARRADSKQRAREIVLNPTAELGPPRPQTATAGRMNPDGISVFYGALSKDTAIAEVRPYVGSLVVVGQFVPSRKLRLLDLTKIGVGFTGSIFAPDYEDRAARLQFLDGFHTLIARPIQPHDEPLEYIPTQAVAEYVSSVLGFDGILYASAQVGAITEESDPSPIVQMGELSDDDLKKHNVVLLGKAAIVKQTTVSAETGEAPYPKSSPTWSLAFQADSARIVRVTGVKYDHSCIIISDQGRPPDF